MDTEKIRRKAVSGERYYIKTGWWKVSFEITLEGKEVQFKDLSEVTQDHILEAIKDECRQGEVVEDGYEEDEDDPEEDPCDSCGYDSEVACRGCLKKI
jgi:hypothetical protein